MRNLLIASAVAIAAASPAYAQTPSITFTNGVYTLPAGATIFQNFDNGGASNTQYSPLANEIVTGDVRTQSGSLPGTAQDPDVTTGNKYLAVEGGNPQAMYGVTLPGAVQVFSFILGSLDNYNELKLFFANGTNLTLTGQQIITNPANAGGPVGPFNTGTSGRVTFDMGGQSGITYAEFRSTNAAFEIDDLASAVPEPATWGMMIMGFGLIGSQLRSRRSRKTTLATA